MRVYLNVPGFRFEDRLDDIAGKMGSRIFDDYR